MAASCSRHKIGALSHLLLVILRNDELLVALPLQRHDVGVGVVLLRLVVAHQLLALGGVAVDQVVARGFELGAQDFLQ